MRRAVTAIGMIASLVACGEEGRRGLMDYATSEQALTVCPDAGTQLGVDVSAHQGSDVPVALPDWSKVASSGRTFAIAKATEGVTFTDPDFSTNWPAMKQAGLIRGAYHFFHSTDDGKAQADLFLQVVGTLDPTDLPPVLDWEVDDGQTPATMISVAQAFIDEIRAQTGLPTFIYTAPGWFSSTVGQPAQFGTDPLWIANWQANCPTVDAPWSSWILWQDNDTSTVPGINTQVDTDQFNGTLLQLQNLQQSLGGHEPDAGQDGGIEPDAGVDAGFDAGTQLDAGLDAGQHVDAGSDAGSGHDAGLDAGEPPDAGRDAGPSPDSGSTGPHPTPIPPAPTGCGCGSASAGELPWLCLAAAAWVARRRRRR